MQHLRSIRDFLFVALALSALSGPAQAQSTRTFVSGTGDDNSVTCSRTAPCRTFGGAFAKTSLNGEIDCLDPGGYAGVTITKSITIDCTGTLASILNDFITINIPASAVDFRIVRLRGLSLNGGVVMNPGGGAAGQSIGVTITSAAVVVIEDSVISDYLNLGIFDFRTGGGKLFIRNTVIRDNLGPGIVAASTGGPYGASIENVHSINNGYGIAAASGNNVMIARSVLSGNKIAGIEADTGAQVGIDSSVVSFNAVSGLQNGGTMSVSNSDITFNQAAISGNVISFGNNRIYGNSTPGNAPIVGTTSSDHGQQ